MRGIYTLVWYLLLPFLLLRLLWRSRHEEALLQNLAQRLGYIPQQSPIPRCWIHAVSVGEVIAASTLIQCLQAHRPSLSLLLSTTTPSGAKEARRRLGTQVTHVYFPFDLPHAVRRFLVRAKPSALIVLETELWPNLLAQCHAQSIPAFLVNARLSPRSAKGYACVPSLTRQTLRHLNGIAARDRHDAQRFIALGAAPERVCVLGNLKFDQTAPADAVPKAHRLRAQWGATRPVWLGASTHPGEDRPLLKAHQALRHHLPEALLLLAPRHPHRAKHIETLCHEHAMKVVRRTHWDPTQAPLPPEVAVLLIDTLGELGWLYGCADVAFVGGSLVRHGGHNPLEPAHLGIPILSGPHVFNFKEIYQLLEQADAVRWLDSSTALTAVLLELFQDSAQREALAQAAICVLDAHRGSAQRIVEWLQTHRKAT